MTSKTQMPDVLSKIGEHNGWLCLSDVAASRKRWMSQQNHTIMQEGERLSKFFFFFFGLRNFVKAAIRCQKCIEQEG